jgi:hypothetical protein
VLLFGQAAPLDDRHGDRVDKLDFPIRQVGFELLAATNIGNDVIWFLSFPVITSRLLTLPAGPDDQV